LAGYLPAAFELVCGSTEAVAGPIPEAELIGIGAEDTYVKKRQLRFTKSCKWLHSPSTPVAQAVGATLLLPLVALMGDFFDKARFDCTSASSVSRFCSAQDSPACKVFASYLRYLASEELHAHVHWLFCRAFSFH
jgi:hypothetical protein